jgi:hypothetical protein
MRVLDADRRLHRGFEMRFFLIASECVSIRCEGERVEHARSISMVHHPLARPVLDHSHAVAACEDRSVQI